MISVVQALYPPCTCRMLQIVECGHSAEKLGFTRFCGIEAIGLSRNRKSLLKPILAKEDNGASRIEDGHQVKKPNGLAPLANHSAALIGTISIFRFYQDLESVFLNALFFYYIILVIFCCLSMESEITFLIIIRRYHCAKWSHHHMFNVIYYFLICRPLSAT